MNEFLLGKTESEHNAFCDSMKCEYGNYCNPITGLCSYHRPKPIRELTDVQKQEMNKWCALCDRPLGIYGNGYSHNVTYHFYTHRRTLCNECVTRVSR